MKTTKILFFILISSILYSQQRKAEPIHFFDIQYQNNCATSLSFQYNIDTPPPQNQAYVFLVADPFPTIAETIDGLGMYTRENINIDNNSNYSARF